MTLDDYLRLQDDGCPHCVEHVPDVFESDIGWQGMAFMNLTRYRIFRCVSDGIRIISLRWIWGSRSK